LKPSTEPAAAEGPGKSEGYAAVPLTGVWANYPYLTTGAFQRSTTCSARSPGARIFSVIAAGHFDREQVGQVLYLIRTMGERGLELLRRFATIGTGSTPREGCGTAGRHVGPHQDRRQPARVDPVLKTL
jgi:hypothetical protein